MQFKFLISLALIAVLVGVALAWRGTTMGLQSREPSNIKVVINQLPAKDGVVPIEIIQPTIVSSAPNARRWAVKVEELDQRAYLYAEIAKESLRAIETQNQAREVLDEILSVAGKAPNTIVTARTLLAVAYLYTKIDLGRSIAVLGDAIKCINHLEKPDFSRPLLVRRIEGKNFARYATFEMPGLSPESVFRELGKADFDNALYQASNLSDKSLRALATLALADICLQRSQAPNKKRQTKKEPKP